MGALRSAKETRRGIQNFPQIVELDTENSTSKKKKKTVVMELKDEFILVQEKMNSWHNLFVICVFRDFQIPLTCTDSKFFYHNKFIF